MMFTVTACEPNRFVTGWVPWWGGSAGREIIDDPGGAALFGEVSLFWYATAAGGAIERLGSSTSLQTTITSLRAQGLPVVPTITDGTAAGVMSAVLDNPTSRALHVQRIVDLVSTNNFDGIDIDYEVFAFSQTSQWSSIKPDWVAFITELGTALHAKGKLLSVTVPPVYIDSSNRTRGYTVYAQDQIASSVDRLRLMAYDWSGSWSDPGPIGYPLSVLQRVIAYSSSVVPVAKLQLGVPAYGRRWTVQRDDTDDCPANSSGSWSVTIAKSAELIAKSGTTPLRDAASGELMLTWTEVLAGTANPPTGPDGWVPPRARALPTEAIPAEGLAPAVRVSPQFTPPTCTLEHTAYIPDAATLRQRAEMALAAGWSGIAIWAMGYENAAVYEALAGVDSPRPNGTPVTVLDAPVVNGTSVSVTGHAFDPEFDLPVPVRVRITKVGGSVVSTRTTSARWLRGGMPTGIGPYHGFAEPYSLAAGTYEVCATQLQWGGGDGVAAPCRTFTVT